MTSKQFIKNKKIKKKDQKTTEKKKKDILGLSNNRKLQQTKEKERLVAAASLCKGRTISCKNDNYIFLLLNEKKMVDNKGVFQGF